MSSCIECSLSKICYEGSECQAIRNVVSSIEPPFVLCFMEVLLI